VDDLKNNLENTKYDNTRTPKQANIYTRISNITTITKVIFNVLILFMDVQNSTQPHAIYTTE
jgi:hypothetical protein